jgi:catechol 2,3-dioxygenase-like lactoylglutathione lyase family enzyme
MMNRHLGRVLCVGAVTALAWPLGAAVQSGPPSPHTVTTTKFTIDDVAASTAFYEDLVGLPELRRFEDEGRLVEPFMGWSENGRMGLLAYTVKETVAKSPYPVSVVFLPDLDAVAARFEAAGQPFQPFSGEATGGVRLAIVTDPSGNAIELVEREGTPAVGGARLIVQDRAQAEEFFVRMFGAEPGDRVETDTFDEVFMDVGEGMFVALFEPKGVAPLPKSEHPVVAI